VPRKRGSEPDNELVVAVFDERRRGREALAAAREQAAKGGLHVRDACLVTRRPDGKVDVMETSDITTGKAAGYGAAWGLFMGAALTVPIVGLGLGAGAAALAARRHDVGITDEFERLVAERLTPGKTALVLLTRPEDARRFAEGATRQGATVVTLSIDEAAARAAEAHAARGPG
jgi:uncharacterized membrane protein